MLGEIQHAYPTNTVGLKLTQRRHLPAALDEIIPELALKFPGHDARLRPPGRLRDLCAPVAVFLRMTLNVIEKRLFIFI